MGGKWDPIWVSFSSKFMFQNLISCPEDILEQMNKSVKLSGKMGWKFFFLLKDLKKKKNNNPQTSEWLLVSKG